MNLDDLGEIWGVDLENAKEYGSLRRITNTVILLACVVVVLSIISIMKSTKITYGAYLQAMFFLVAISFSIYGLCVRNKLYKVYRFYRRHKKATLQHIVIKVSTSELYGILYKAKKVRLKEDDTIENYITLLNTSCCLDTYFAKYLIKSLLALPENKEGVSLELYYTEKGNSRRYVGIKPLAVQDDKPIQQDDEEDIDYVSMED